MIKTKTLEEIAIMHEGGKILHKILATLMNEVRGGMTTEDIDQRARQLIEGNGVKPSFLGYNNYPAVICTSVNHELVHSVPSNRKLKDGDLLKLDFGVIYKGFHTDSAVTVLIDGQEGKKEEKLKLIKITREALSRGIKKAKIGNRVGDIGFEVQKFVEHNGFNVARELVGHGIGRSLHEEPYVPNYGNKGTGPELVEGMVIAIEPIVMMGNWKTIESEDGHGFETKDQSLAAHFEHTIAVTKNGPVILTAG